MLLNALQGRTGEIARTVEREITAVAPYAELGLAMGVPTWHLHDRVVSLLPLPQHCQLHFWQGDRLQDLFPGKLQGSMSGPIRYVRLESILDVNGTVQAMMREAFVIKVAELAAVDQSRASGTARSPCGNLHG